MTDDQTPEVICAPNEPELQRETQDAREKKPRTMPPLSHHKEHDSLRSSLFVRLLSSISIRYKIAGTLIVFLCLAVASLGVVTFTVQKSILWQELRSRAEVLVLQLANAGKEGLLTKQELPVVVTIADIQTRPDVVYAMVIDDTGKVFAHSDFSRKGIVLKGSVDRNSMKTDTLLYQELDLDSAPVLDAAVPIFLKKRNLKIGVARIGLSEKALIEAIRRQTRIYLWVALVFVVGGLLAAFALARIITKSLNSLEEGIQVVARGDLRRLVPVVSNDEIGKLTTTFNNMILNLREKLLMEKYLSQPTVQSIKELSDVAQLKLGGERRYVTALFSDVRGFTSLSEKMSPEDVVRIMNVYLNLQAKVIHQFGGTIDKFVGDEVMAIFPGAGSEVIAVRAAVEIQSYCRALNEARAAAGERTISIGIGLNNGEVVMGNMGSEDHMDYTVIGDNINIAARICGIAQAGSVLISKAVAEAVGDQASLKDERPVVVKGKDQPIGVAEVVMVKGGLRRAMRKATDAPAIYLHEGFPDDPSSCTIKNVGPAGCLLEVAAPVGIGSKLSIHFSLPPAQNVVVRATTHHARKQDAAYYIGVCFDDLSDETRHSIVQWIHEVNSEII